MTHLLYRELKSQALTASNTDLEDAIEAVRDFIIQELDSAGIRWTSDIPLREAMSKLQRVCRYICLERDTAREQVMKLKEKVSAFEKKDNDQVKRSREQQSAMVQAIKIRAEKERRQLDRKYKLQIKEDEKKIFETAKAEYVKMNQDLTEKMSDHLKQVELAYIAACESHQRKLADLSRQIEINNRIIRDQLQVKNTEMKLIKEFAKKQEQQLAELMTETHLIQLKYQERRLQVGFGCCLSSCIDELLVKFHQRQNKAQCAADERERVRDDEHAAEIEKINRKVKDIIDKKDRQIFRMKEAIDTLHRQLDELTALPGSE